MHLFQAQTASWCNNITHYRLSSRCPTSTLSKLSRTSRLAKSSASSNRQQRPMLSRYQTNFWRLWLFSGLAAIFAMTARITLRSSPPYRIGSKTTRTCFFTLGNKKERSIEESYNNGCSFSSDLTSRPWNEVMFVVTVCDILTAEVALEAEVANKNKDNNWDLVLCSLSSWMQSVEENRGHFMESAEVSKQCLYKVSRSYKYYYCWDMFTVCTKLLLTSSYCCP